MRKTTIKETIYGGGLHIVVCPEQKFIDFFNKKYREDDEVEGNLGQLFRSDKADKIYQKGLHTYLWMEKFDKNKQNDIDTLFHELEHCVLFTPVEVHHMQLVILLRSM